jgi:hypothetical protein
VILDLLRGTFPREDGVTEVVAEVLFGPGEDFLRRTGGVVRVA